MKNTLRFAALAVVFAAANAHAVDAFDPATNLLTLDSVTTGGVTYRNVAVNLASYDLISVAGGAPAADTFDAANNTLLMGAVAYQGTVYNNVSVKINAYSILSVGGPLLDGSLNTANYTDVVGSYLSTLNNYRTQCGIPALTQNTRLDSAASSIGSPPGPFAWAASAGYSVTGGAGGLYNGVRTDSANNGLIGRTLFQISVMEPVALLNMMRPYTDVGFVYNLQLAGGRRPGTRIIFGNPVARNTPPVTFPCANTTDAPPYQVYSGSTPYASVAPTSLYTFSTDWTTGRQGTPIAVFANPGENLVLTNATVTMRGGAAVPVTLKSNHRDLYAYEGFVWPQQNLLPNTTYDVVIFGTVNGAAFGKNFAFRTGAAIPLSLP